MRVVLFIALLCCFAAPARGVDSMSFEAGRGNEATDLWRVGLQWKWDKRWWERGGWHLGAYWDLQYGQWNNGHDLHDISLTPTFRYQRSSGAVIPYVEGAIGFHMLSDLRISSRRLFSTHFQFGDHLGAGLMLGKHDLGVRLQHVSNGRLARPNPGINFLQLRYQFHFD
jgi:lipid A 3-O-deacylase